ncbi:MAG: type II secretion system protein GspG [Planctomycetota bacterium]
MLQFPVNLPIPKVRVRKTVWAATICSLLVASNVFAQTTSTTIRLRDYLTNDVMIYVEAPDFQSTLKRGKNIPLTKIIREEEFQQFLTPLWTLVRTEIDTALKSIDEKPENWQSCPLRSFELAYGRTTEFNTPAFIIKIDGGLLNDTIRKVLQKPEYKTLAEITEVEGSQIISSMMSPNASLLMIRDTLMIIINTEGAEKSAPEIASSFVKLFKSEKAKNSLSTDSEYLNLVGKFQTKQPEWTAFFRPATLVSHIVASSGFAPRSETAASKPSAPRRGGSGAAIVSSMLELASSAAKELGLADLRAMMLAESYSDAGVTTEIAMLIPPSSPLIASTFGSGKPADRAFLDKALDGVDGFTVGSFDPIHIYNALEKSLAKHKETNKDFMNPIEVLASFEKKHQFNLRTDFFEAVGPEYYSYSFPPRAAGGGFPSWDSFIVLRVRDKAKLEKLLLTLANAVNEAKLKEFGVDISEPTANRPAIYSLRINAGEGQGVNPLMVQMAQQFGVSLSVADDWLFISTNPIALKTELRNIKKPRDASADVKKALLALPAEASSLTYTDWKPFVRTIWDTLASFAGLAGGAAEDLPVNLQEIPTSQSLVKHFKVSTGFWTITKDGLYGRSTGTFGLELYGSIAGLATGVGAAMQLERQQQDEADDMNEPPMPDEPTDPAGNAEEALTKAKIARAESDIRTIADAIDMYKISNSSKLPADLDVLLKPTDDQPNGYLRGRKSLVDPWGNSYIFKATVNGDYALRSSGPNARDEDGTGDDISKK